MTNDSVKNLTVECRRATIQLSHQLPSVMVPPPSAALVPSQHLATSRPRDWE